MSNQVKVFLYRWLPPFLVMGVIFWFSSRSSLPGAGPQIIWWDFVAKKTAHLIEYGLLFYAWQRALNWNRSEDKKTYWLAFLLVFVYAVSDEFHQSFTPTRHPQFRDVGFDCLGGFLVYLKQRKLV